MNKKVKQVTESILITQLCLFMNEQIKGTNYYVKSLKNRGNLFLKELIKVEYIYDEMYNDKEESCTEVTNIVQDLVIKIGELGFENYGQLSLMIDAYKKDPKSIEGITRKILK